MIDTSEVIAWARGEFNFKNAPIQSITRGLERWYDISVVYHDQIPDKGFTLQVPRSTDFAKVQSLLANQGLQYPLLDNRNSCRFPDWVKFDPFLLVPIKSNFAVSNV